MNRVTQTLSFCTFALLAAGCSKHSPETRGESPAALPVAQVRTTTIDFKDLPALNEITGTIRPVRSAMVAPKVMGTIEEFPVTLGQQVQAGDVLVRISASEINARVAQAKAQLNQVQRDLARERALLEKNASTTDMVKNLEDRKTITEAMVHEAETMLGYTTIQAPFSGRVARKMGDVGDLSAPGMPLLEIEETHSFEINAGVPDSLADHVKIGSELLVEVPAADTSFRAEVTEISSSSDANAHTVPIKLAVPPDVSIRSGQFARVHVPGRMVKMLLVPNQAISALGQMDRIFVVSNGHAQLRLVKTGATHGETTEILAGLEGGETIVVDPPNGLREGQPVEVRP